MRSNRPITREVPAGQRAGAWSAEGYATLVYPGVVGATDHWDHDRCTPLR